MFEVIAKDAMGRIGKLETPHGKVETPVLMPVVNPNVEMISAKELKDLGAEMLITNAYIIYRTPELRERALENGVHSLLGVELPVMTDSGSYQLMVYGDVEVGNEEILRFQMEIGSDVVVPLDIPTPPDADYETAKRDLEITLEREREAKRIKGGNSLLALPVQGSTHLDLRRRSAEEAKRIGGDVYAIGGIVPLMDTYRFSDLVRIILEVKSVLPSNAPVHLFGAGHPMVFAMAVALGCDLFDSAAYALYAKDGRYLTPYGTKKLEELQYFPCSCPVCLEHTPEELRRMDEETRARLLAEHNLRVCFEEIRRIKQAIRENSLFELVECRIRSHPNLLFAWRQIREYGRILELYDPSSKHSFLYTGVESCYRPAVIRHWDRVLNVELPDRDEIVISSDEGVPADFYLRPCFGVVPVEMLESYPAGHAEIPPPELLEDEALRIAVEGLRRFLRHHSDRRFLILVGGKWRDFVRDLPENAVIRDVGEEGRVGEDMQGGD